MPLLTFPNILKGWGPVGGGSAVNTPALLVSNAGDGTGVATVSGSTAGTTNTVYYAAPSTGTITWLSAGTRVGDGNVTVSPGAGAWLYYVSSTDGSTTGNSPPVYQPVTGGSPAPSEDYGRILAAVVGLVQAAGFANAKERKLPVVLKADEATLPMVLVCPVREAVAGYVSGGAALIKFELLVIYVAGGNQQYETGINDHLAARHAVWESLRVTSIPGTGVLDYTLDFDPVFDSTALLQGGFDFMAVRVTYESDDSLPG